MCCVRDVKHGDSDGDEVDDNDVDEGNVGEM